MIKAAIAKPNPMLLARQAAKQQAAADAVRGPTKVSIVVSASISSDSGLTVNMVVNLIEKYPQATANTAKVMVAIE